ncbi:MoxR family ATPase [Pseudorhodoferax sp. Leaf274]|uniref:AAA family ATPase n=1 Tax=Pseudorhodoferax sp. Leaf274 TaxID=1736318 RepID=UPI000702A46C|nr:MoxR family ATPase [Pseudorhodoferax sp. Leaf274]KQP35847.1 ATPase [Pseudorhodoferax sp. Leaf274]
MNAAIPPSTPPGLASIDAVVALLAGSGYIATRQIATALYLAHHLRKPVLIEGPAGVGKTELAVSAARALQFALLRLQCYEGLDDSRALYEWKYGKQLLYTQILKEKIGLLVDGADTLAGAFGKLAGFQDLFFSRDFLEPRPLLQAMEQPGGSVLLIDEVDKSEESFEALLLEVLADYQVTIPEIGTIRAQVPPLVILTSNNTRELGDALKRRCLHLHIGFPDAALEQRVLRARVPGIADALLAQLVAFVQALRADNIRKPPSIAESVDWARTLVLMHANVLDEGLVRDTLGVLLKRESDVREVEGRLGRMTQAALAAVA